MRNLFLGLPLIIPARESLFSDIPAGDGKIVLPFFYSAVLTPKL